MNKLKTKKKFDLQKKITSLKNVSVKVGFPSDNAETESTDQEGVTALDKATKNNFGLGVPKRPFMNMAFTKNKNNYRKIIKKQLSKIEKLDFIEFLNSLGLKAQGDVQKAIVGLRNPANSPMTIKLKGSSNPLIDSGHMLQSVTFIVKEK
jgi:hypothetical protein